MAIAVVGDPGITCACYQYSQDKIRRIRHSMPAHWKTADAQLAAAHAKCRSVMALGTVPNAIRLSHKSAPWPHL
jgi:hypothetical protein